MPDSTDHFDSFGPGESASFRSAIEHVAAGMSVLFDDGRFAWVNDRLCQMLGYTQQELLATNSNAVTHPADRESDLARLGQLNAGSVRSYCAEKRWLHKSGQDVSTVEIVAAIRRPGANDLQVFCCVHDAADSKLETTASLALERLATTRHMVASIAHEGRNALQQIGGCAEMLAMELEGFPEALDLLAGVQEAEARLLRLFEDLRIHAAPLHLDRRKCDLAALWRKAWAALAARNPARDMTLVEVISADDVCCSVAANYVEQAFFKIFENALDACKDPVSIEVTCWAAELGGRPALAVSLRDTGTGFAAGALANAFEPFYTTKTQGAGLGLTVVRRIIEAHEGNVRIQNPAQGGAVVELWLPRYA